MMLKDVYELVKVEVEELSKYHPDKDYKRGKALSKAIDEKLEDIYDEDVVDRDKEGHKLLRYIEQVQDKFARRCFKVDIKLEDIDLNKEV